MQKVQLADVILKSGKRVIKKAVAWELRNDDTGKDHHMEVMLETLRLEKKGGGWAVDEKKSLTLDDEEQIACLTTFLGALNQARDKKISGNVLLTPLANGVDLGAARRALEILASESRSRIMVELLEAVSGDVRALQTLTSAARSSPSGLRAAVGAINIGRFECVLEELSRCIESNAREATYQGILTDNPWLFGSEYSERHARRSFTRDQQQDFMLRRTVDGCLELIEIKTPLDGKPLFVADKSHQGAWVPRHELSAALSQVMRDLEKLDDDVLRIRANDDEDVRKVRARIIIGRDGSREQVAALRRLNGHLHRVEVMTFDMLLRIGRRVVGALMDATQTIEDGSDEIPF
ncbi:Shedu anti-phage system protein SduA domain-containing protein [Myxococcus xanthus]|uniref:Shedu anti-phage system protein SduA domain-containing protein n=1 Tax=Myxococcus xanthus TaxID=34 RepID=UPI0013757B93|nr:Shedu anti-phage system protein SduA domain-containing protein [Myxococcus xanthus]